MLLKVDPFADESDPNAPQFATFPEGNVDVAGIFDFQTVEEGSGLPFFKLSNDRPVARFHLRLMDGSKGPIMSADAAQLALLAMAFGGNDVLPYLEGLDRLTSGYLLACKQAANCEMEHQAKTNRAIQKQVAYVNDRGWVANVSGTKPPLNTLFRIRFKGFRNLDGSEIPAFQPGKFDSAILFQFQIVSDMWGKPCPYTGYVESVRLNKAFDGVREVEGADGIKRLVPRLRLTETNAKHIAATRLQAFVNAFCPELSEHVWQADPTKSAYGVNETENPLPVIVALALKGNRTAVGQYETTQKKTVYLAMEGFAPVPEDLQPSPTPVAAAPVAQASKTNLTNLVNYIDAQCAIEKNAGAFVDKTINLNLSPVGIDWCKEHMTNLWTELGLPADRKLALLAEEQAGNLLAALVNKVEASGGF